MTEAASDPLALAAKGGDQAAFGAILRREKAGLYAFVRRYVGNSDDAYDVVQEAFVAAWRAMGRYDPARPFPVWLRAIALNKCRDYGRRAKVRRAVMGLFAAEPERPTSDPNAEADVDRLDRAIAKLPAHYKEPLLLTTAGRLSYEEAAQALRLSPKAVEMRLYRARRQLAEILRQLGEG